MGIEKHVENSFGGFLPTFEWNAKSRKKLFSINSDIAEQSKLKKRCDGNQPMARLRTLAEDESIKGSSDHSCASSVIDDDFGGTRAPGVVARLMGLDSFPRSDVSGPCSTPLFNLQSVCDADSRANSHGYCQSQVASCSRLQDTNAACKYQKVIHKPVDKFGAEVLPPKSARSIPITHHKLLSPIKSASFVPSKDASQIMEAAARIIQPGPPAKKKMQAGGSSSVPLKLRDLKEKVQVGGSQRKGESGVIKVPDSEEFSKNKGKSISLALLAKANVQKRGGMSLDNRASTKEPCEVSPDLMFKDRLTTQKSVIKKQSAQSGTSVLRPNNQKQNGVIDRGKPASKDSAKRQPNASKLPGGSKVRSRCSGSDVKDGNGEVSSSSTGRITRKKRSIDGKYCSEKSKPSNNIRPDKNGKAVQSSSWDQDSRRTGKDVISFTFTSPMTQLGPDSSVSQSITSPLSSDGSCASKFAFPGYNVKGSDALSILLEQKLKELAHKVEFSQPKLGNILHDVEHGEKGVMSSTMKDRNVTDDRFLGDNQVLKEEDDTSTCDNNVSRAQKLLYWHLPSPVSVLESCNSSDAANSDGVEGSEQCSSMLVLDLCSLRSFVPIEEDAELCDSASSTVTKMQETTAALADSKRCENRELEYVKKLLCNIEPMFTDYALDRTDEIINCRHFHQMGNQKCHSNQRLMFDCVRECFETRCRQYACGGFELWAKGVSMIRRKDKLAEEVYKEILDWRGVGDSMIDELVDQDMSSQYGKWLDFDTESFKLGVQIEARLLNALVDEVVADLLVV